MMKRAGILMLVLCLALLPGMSASAETNPRPGDYERYEDAIYREMDKYTDNALPFQTWVDINGDGYYEAVLDNSDGEKGDSLFDLCSSARYGQVFLLVKGDCTVFWYDPVKKTAQSRVMKNDNMYFSFNERDHCFITSFRDGENACYMILELMDDYSMREVVYRMTPYGEVLSTTVNGKVYGVDDEVSYRASTFGIPAEIFNCKALSFTRYS